MWRSVFVNFAFVFLFLSWETGGQQYEGDPCDLSNGGLGKCQIIDKCEPVYQDLLSGISPDTLCGFSGYDPIVCCPNTNSGTPKPPPTSETPPPTRQTPPPTRQTPPPTRRTPPPTRRTPPPTRRTSEPTRRRTTETPTIDTRKPGDLARQKCAEYASSVYALVDPETLSVISKKVNISLCAIKSKKLIVGGTKADPKEFPHMAAIGFNSRSQGIVWLCGGTLVSDTFVMTAAHCTYSLEYGAAARVRVGDLNLVRTNDDAKPQERRVIERIRNPSYKKPAEYHDIALLRLESPVTFDAYVRPACLPASRDIGHSEVVATGWGRVSWDEEEISNDLLKVTIATVSQERCNATFISGSVDYKLKRGIIDDWQICAGEEGKDTCQGDSGGPIAVFDPDYECMYDVVGITSLGRLCGSIVPGVYTRVYNYISWLENTIWKT